MRKFRLIGRSRRLILAFVIVMTGTAAAKPADHKVPCQPAEKILAQQAVTDAKEALTRTIATLTHAQPADTARQAKWFGVLNSTTAAAVLKVYRDALGASNFTHLWCPVSNDLDFAWQPGDLAAVHSSEPGSIFLTPAFFKLPKTGVDSQRGTMVHELTHVVGVGLKPELYGPTEAKNLAKSDAVKARKNSDNYQYYVEDLLWGIP